MQNVTSRAWPDRTLTPFCWADRRVLEQPCFRCMGAVGELLSGCVSFSGKHLPGPPTPTSHPVYLSIWRRLLSAYWRLPPHHPPPPLVCTLELPWRMEAWKARITALSLSPAPALCSAWTRLGVSSANKHPEEFQPHSPGSPHRVQLALQRASYSKYTFLRLPSLSPGGSELPPLLPHWEKKINIHPTGPCLLLLCRNCNNLAEEIMTLISVNNSS